MIQLRSQLYCKCQLCCCLQGQSNSMDFIEFLWFEHCMAGTLAAPLIQLWVCCEAYCIGVQQRWASLRSLRLHCSSIPFLSDMVWISVVSILEVDRWYYRQLAVESTGCIPCKINFYSVWSYTGYHGFPSALVVLVISRMLVWVHCSDGISHLAFPGELMHKRTQPFLMVWFVIFFLVTPFFTSYPGSVKLMQVAMPITGSKGESRQWLLPHLL